MASALQCFSHTPMETTIFTTLAILLTLSTFTAPCCFALAEMAIEKLQVRETLLLSSVVGPESLAFDSAGQGPYTGVSDGRVLKWQGNDLGWTQFATTSEQRADECNGFHDSMLERVCGRPLGLQFDRTSGELYIADAYFGLLAVGADGGVARQVATDADGEPFNFTNGVDVDQENGIVYFTDSSTRFQRRDYMLAVIARDATGRLMSYNPKNKELIVLFKSLAFPNGVVMSEDNAFLLVAETNTCRVLRYWLRGPKVGELEVFTELPGYPDNIKRNPRGEFWVALNYEKLPIPGGSEKLFRWQSERALAVKLSKKGAIVEVLKGRVLGSISEVEERNKTLWVGSVVMPYVGVYQI